MPLSVASDPSSRHTWRAYENAVFWTTPSAWPQHLWKWASGICIFKDVFLVIRGHPALEMVPQAEGRGCVIHLYVPSTWRGVSTHAEVSNEDIKVQGHTRRTGVPGGLGLTCFIAADRLLLWKRALLRGRGQGRRDRRAPGGCTHVHERPEERGGESLPVHHHEGTQMLAWTWFNVDWHGQ